MAGINGFGILISLLVVIIFSVIGIFNKLIILENSIADQLARNAILKNKIN